MNPHSIGGENNGLNEFLDEIASKPLIARPRTFSRLKGTLKRWRKFWYEPTYAQRIDPTIKGRWAWEPYDKQFAKIIRKYSLKSFSK